MKTALITGVTGQDGSYMAELLLSEGFRVFGMVRRSTGPKPNMVRLVGDPNFIVVDGDVTDISSLHSSFSTARPDQVYHFADQDHVGLSNKIPEVALQVTIGGAMRVLEVAGKYGCRVFIPSSATVFDRSEYPQNEGSPRKPVSNYAVGKAAVWDLAAMHRKRGLDARVGIMFNHDSPRRSGDYLLHSIARQAVRIANGCESAMYLHGPPTEPVDIGWAVDHVDAAYRLMQLEEAADCVIGTGDVSQIHDLAAAAFERLGRVVDVRYVTTEQQAGRLQADPTLIRTLTGWTARTTARETLALVMDRYLMESAHEGRHNLLCD